MPASTSQGSQHPVPLTAAAPPASDVSTLFARLHALLPALADGAAEREQQRTLPYVLVRRIAEAGLLTVRIPKRYGGPGGTVRDAMRVMVCLSAGAGCWHRTGRR